MRLAAYFIAMLMGMLVNQPHSSLAASSAPFPVYPDPPGKHEKGILSRCFGRLAPETKPHQKYHAATETGLALVVGSGMGLPSSRRVSM